MSCKYVHWTNGDYVNGQALMRVSNMAALLATIPSYEEKHESIATYNPQGEAISCPMYYDVDDESLWDAMENTAEIVSHYLHMDIEPSVWFSGSKGFHILIPEKIVHPRCWEIARMIAEENVKEFDWQVYRSRGTLRAPYSINKKSGLYKIPVDLDQILHRDLEGILKAAKSNNPDHFTHVSDFRIEEIMEIECYIERLPDPSKRQNLDVKRDYNKDMPPCVKTIWEMRRPPAGKSHLFINTFAKFCHQAGLSEEEVCSLFGKHRFFGSEKYGECCAVVKSIYVSGKTGIGCKRGAEANMMRDHCTSLCPFNEDAWKDLRLKEMKC